MNEQPSFLEDLKQIVISYFEAKIKLYKISTYEKTAKVIAVLLSSILIASLSLILLLFLSISGGFFFGKLLNSNSLGFLLIFGGWAVLLIFIIIFRKKMERGITNKVIEQLIEKEEENDQ